jgi:hypothetical protein
MLAKGNEPRQAVLRGSRLDAQRNAASANNLPTQHVDRATQLSTRALPPLFWGTYRRLRKALWGRDMMMSNAGRLTATGKPFFRCPNCDALYHIVKAEAGPESADREIMCRACGGPLPGREGKFVMKYFPAAMSCGSMSALIRAPESSGRSIYRSPNEQETQTEAVERSRPFEGERDDAGLARFRNAKGPGRQAHSNCIRLATENVPDSASPASSNHMQLTSEP